MKPYSWLDLLIGVATFFWGIFLLFKGGIDMALLALAIGAALVYLGIKGGRIALLIFGHGAVIVGCYLVTWGIYLLPDSKPTMAHIFGRPLFWGLFAIFGGICAIYHAFCTCISSRR
jgi:uncharacterized membrane protein HdeD (DUF308 family)